MLEWATMKRNLFPHAEEPYLSRFLESVREDGDHMLWAGRLMPNGYGAFQICGQTVTAHHLAYEWANGPIYSWMEVDHLCRVILCVRPDHLEAVTHLENVRRGRAAEALMASQNPLAKYLIANAVSIADFAERADASPQLITKMIRGDRPRDSRLVYRVGDMINLSWEETDSTFLRQRRRI